MKMKQALFYPQTGPCYSLFLFTMVLLRMVDAHAGIAKPPSMKVTTVNFQKSKDAN
jgi:hypothetical protein